MILFLVLVTTVPMAQANGLGNEQYYTVYFDGEGDAIVMAKLSFQNTNEEVLETVVLEVPGQINILNLVQELTIRTYDEDYWRGYYDTTEYETVKIETETLSDSTLLTVNFPEEIDEQEIGTILLYYKIEGLAEKNYGLYDFEFTTIKSSYDTYYVRISTDVINDLVMADVDSNVDYKDWGFAESADVEIMAVESISLADEEMAAMSSRIGYYGNVKEAYGLDPYESFTVSGEYAESEFRLHLVRNFILIGVGLLGLIGIIFLARKLFKKNFKKRKYLEMTLVGSLSGVILTAVLALGYYVIENLYYWVGYQFAGFFSFLIGVSLLLISLMALSLPGIYLGHKHKDLLIGLGSAATTVGTVFVLIIIGTVIFAML